MRRFVLFIATALVAFAATPPELELALKNFRPDPPHEWSYTQTTVAEGKSLVERCDGARPEFNRWSLVQKDGRAPTEDELKDYGQSRSQSSRMGNAPRITDQFDLTTIETVTETSDRVTYRCRLRPGESRDSTAPFLQATVVVHKPTHTIESIELSNRAAFSPTLGVKIAELKTVMTYSLPTDTTPALPEKVATHVRGRAFLFKSLDADMTVTFSEYRDTRKK